jgi:hypothetical protein
MDYRDNPYAVAQQALAGLKSAIYSLLLTAPSDGLRNVDIGRALGIYAGHVGHEGHVSRTLLSIMEEEGVVKQDPATNRWSLCHEYTRSKTALPSPGSLDLSEESHHSENRPGSAEP